jgi:hypothetical protein
VSGQDQYQTEKFETINMCKLISDWDVMDNCQGDVTGKEQGISNEELGVEGREKNDKLLEVSDQDIVTAQPQP